MYRALVLAQRLDLAGSQDRWCTQCHSPIGTRSGDIRPGFSFDALSPITSEGVTCDGCHKVTEIRRTHGSGHAIDPAAAITSSLRDPEAPHPAAYSPIYEQPEFCAACHDVITPSGLVLESPFAEWRGSPAAGAEKTCQTCHMPRYAGRAAASGPERSSLHRHTFTGVHVPHMETTSAQEVKAELEAQSDALLRGSARIALQTWQQEATLHAVVLVRNLVDGHDLPTGSNFFREWWVHVEVSDAEGRLLFQSGHLDENGDLYDRYHPEHLEADAQLHTFKRYLIDASGEPTLFPWRARELEGTTIEPGGERAAEYEIPLPQDAAPPIHVRAQLCFRAFTPRLLRALDLAELAARYERRVVDEDERVALPVQ